MFEQKGSGNLSLKEVCKDFSCHLSSNWRWQEEELSLVAITFHGQNQDCAVLGAVQPFLPLTGYCSSLHDKLWLPAPPLSCQAALEMSIPTPWFSCRENRPWRWSQRRWRAAVRMTVGCSRGMSETGCRRGRGIAQLPVIEEKHRIPVTNSYLAFCIRMTLIFMNATGILFEDRPLAYILGYSDTVCTIGFGHLSLCTQASLAGRFSI